MSNKSKVINLKKIFVSGVGRSGTTLIQSMLNAHSKIGVPPEHQMVKKYLVPAAGNSLNIASKSDLKALLQVDQRIADIGMDIDLLLKTVDFDGENIPKSIRSLILSFWQTYLGDEQVVAIGDKDPLYMNYIEELHENFPDAYFLQIIRDPRDVLLSRMKSKWGANTSFLVHLLETKYGLEYCTNKAKTLFGAKYYSFKYEDLLDRPDYILNGICEWLDIPYEQSMLDYHQISASIILKDERSWKKNVQRPLLKKNTQKWKAGLNTKQIRVSETLLKKVLNEYQYATIPKNDLGFLSKQGYQLLFHVFIGLKRLKKNTKLAYL